jgi:hypothetical protein
MEGTTALVLVVQPTADEDDEELAELTSRLRAQLLDLDVDAVDPVTDERAAERGKGLETLIGWLAVRLGKEGLRSVLAAVVTWATRTGHTVEISYGSDKLKITAATPEQQERLVNDFLARHSPGS